MTETPTSEMEVKPGERYRLSGRKEPFTVVDVDDVVAKVQYENGAADDYLLNSDGRFIASHITKLPGDGPTVAEACPADAHEFLPFPDKAGFYQTFCRECNLSVITLIDHAGQLVDKSLLWECPECNRIYANLDASGGFDSNGERICSKCSPSSGSDLEN